MELIKNESDSLFTGFNTHKRIWQSPINYRGNKRRICDWLFKHFLSLESDRDIFVDMFGGGGIVSINALNHGYKYVIYNELGKLQFDLVNHFIHHEFCDDDFIFVTKDEFYQIMNDEIGDGSYEYRIKRAIVLYFLSFSCMGRTYFAAEAKCESLYKIVKLLFSTDEVDEFYDIFLMRDDEREYFRKIYIEPFHRKSIKQRGTTLNRLIRVLQYIRHLKTINAPADEINEAIDFHLRRNNSWRPEGKKFKYRVTSLGEYEFETQEVRFITQEKLKQLYGLKLNCFNLDFIALFDELHKHFDADTLKSKALFYCDPLM